MKKTSIILSALVSGFSCFAWMPNVQAQELSDQNCANEPAGVFFDETILQWQEINRLTCEDRWEEATALMHQMTLERKDDLGCPLCAVTLPLGEVLRQKWQWQEAFEFYNFALSTPVLLDGSEYDAIAYHLVVHGQYYAALDAFRPLGEDYLGHEDGTAFAYVRLGDTLSSLKQWHNAEIAYEKALDIDPQQPFAYQGLGLIFMQYEEWEEAIAAFEKALEFHPTLTEPVEYIEAARKNLQP